jgi:hypothetical protein
MAEKDIIVMSQKEVSRLYVIRQTLDKTITRGQAAKILRLKDRQIRRIAKSVRLSGDVGIRHKARAKRAHNRTADAVKDKAIALCRETYREFGPTHAGEKFLAHHKIDVSVETLRGWFQKEQVPYKGRKIRPHRQWRERKAHRARWCRWTDPITTGSKDAALGEFSWATSMTPPERCMLAFMSTRVCCWP